MVDVAELYRLEILGAALFVVPGEKQVTLTVGDLLLMNCKNEWSIIQKG